MSEAENILTVSLRVKNIQSHENVKLYTQNQGFRLIAYPFMPSNYGLNYNTVIDDYTLGHDISEKHGISNQNECDVGIIDENEHLKNDYESELTFFAFKNIVPGKKYYVIIKCHNERITEEKDKLNFKLRLSRWNYDLNTQKAVEISAVSKNFTKDLIRVDKVLRNMNINVEQKGISRLSINDPKIKFLHDTTIPLSAFH